MINLSSEVIFNIGSFRVTNTLFVTLIVDAFLIFLMVKIRKRIMLYPSKLQNAVESVVEYFYNLTKEVSQERAVSIFPWFMSFFIFIFFSNIIGLLPGVGSIGFYEVLEKEKEFIPFLRPATSDFNTTFALAVVSVVATHILSIKHTGFFNYLGRFFSLNPIFLFVGLLELFSEFAKLFSLSFRLFGNIFAGEVVLSTVSSIFALIVPVPFLMLEGIVALVQALVFSMLTMVFMSILTARH